MTKMMLAGIAIALVSACPAAAADPAQDSVRAVVQRHQDAFARKDVKALLADYADDAVVVFPSAVLNGKAKIEASFAAMFASMPATTKYDVTINLVEGDVGTTTWVGNPGTAKAVEGHDAFVVRGGKIRFQATYGVHPVGAGAGAAK